MIGFVIAVIVLLLDTSSTPQAAVVTLANGREQHALGVEREGATVVLRFAKGTLRVPASEVKSIDAAAPVAASGVDGPKRQEFRTVSFALAGQTFEARIPQEYEAGESAPGARFAAFSAREGQRALRIASSDWEQTFWALPTAVLAHHQEAYPDYELRAERFTRLAQYPAWLVTFHYRRGSRTWVECQGFLDLGTERGVLVVSASESAETGSEVPEWIVQAVGTSLAAKRD
ncbi:MAG: hypothetical protein AB7O52_09580 [Planctomycetota bacterium]